MSRHVPSASAVRRNCRLPIHPPSLRLVLAAVAAFLVASETPAAEPDPLPQLRELWKSQRSDVVSCRIKFKGFRPGGSDLKALSPQQVADIFRSGDLGNHPENLGQVIKALRRTPITTQLPWGENEFFLEGSKRR